jgi:hypothetical protein
MVNLGFNHVAFFMTTFPEELANLQSFLQQPNYLQWQEQWQRANPRGYKKYYSDEESLEEVHYFLIDEFKSNVTQILRQFSQSLTQKRISELANTTGNSADYCKYGKALREILENIRSSKITSKYAELLHKLFTETTAKLQEKLDIDLAYNTQKEISEPTEEESVNLKSTDSKEPLRKKRGKRRIPEGGYQSIHPNPEEAVRQQFKFLDRRICRVSTLSEDEFEQFVLATTAMIDQNATIADVGQFAKAVNSEITYSVLTFASSDLKRTIFGRNRPDFYMVSMANLFAFDPERLYKDFSEGELEKWWKETFPKYEINA